MATARGDEEGIELAELSLNDDARGFDGEEEGPGDGDGDGQGGEGGDRAPLLAADGDVRAERRARRARKREAESTTLRRRLRLLWKTLCGLLCLGTAVSTAVTLVAAIELRRHLGRSFFALPLSVHLLLDALLALTPLLAARGDGEGDPPPPIPTSQVEFQRQLRAGLTIAQARRRPEDDDETCVGVCCGCCFRLGLSRGTAAVLALAYALIDAAWCGVFAVGALAAAWATAVEADGTVAPEWTGMHAALAGAAVLSGVAAGVRVLAAFSIASYLRTRSRLVYVLRNTSDPPWHYTMSPLMERLAIRQAGLLVAVSCLLVAVGTASYLFHWTVNTESADHYGHCDPLDTTICALPFPSSFFLEEAAISSSLPTTKGAAGVTKAGTGYKVSFGPTTLPYTRGRKNVSPAALNAFDGFSTLAPILFYLEGMSSSGFAGPGDIGASLHSNSTTWLIDADTGRMVPHFVELDALDPESPLAVLQPAAPLRHGTRYIVAVCGALGDWGELLSPTPGFQELVEAAQADRMTKVRPDLRLRANRFSAEVFPALRNIGLGSGSGVDDYGGVSSAAAAAAVAPPPSGHAGAGGAGDGSASSSSPSGKSAGGIGNETGPGARRIRRRRQQAVYGNRVAGVAGEGWGVGEGLVGAGLGDVQLAWDFVTASEESQLGVLRAMGETSKAWLDAALLAGSAAAVVPPPRRRQLWENIVAMDGEGGSTGGSAVGDNDGDSNDSGSDSGSDDRAENQRRRRTTSNNEAPAASSAPLYRVVKVEEFGDYKNTNDGDGAGGDDGDDDAAAGGDRESGSNAEHPAIVRAVWGRMRVPAFVSPFSRGTGLQRLTTLEAGFVVRVPRCVALGEKKPSAVVQYGHGLFGDRSEMEDGFLDVMAERGAWVLVAADWRGMSRIDLAVVARALVSRPELLLEGTPEDLMQGFVNQEAVLALVSRRLGDFLGDGAVELSEEELRAVPLTFYGISQGAILGAGYTEFSSLIRRSVLGSGGTPFSLLMPRSVDFRAYHDLLKLNVPSARGVRLLLSLLQMSWDRLEAAAWLASDATAAAATSAEDTGNSADDDSDEDSNGEKIVLMQAGTGDAEVSVIGTEILARAYQATAVSPVAVPAWGIPPTAAAAAEASPSSSCGGNGASPSASLALYDYRREAAEVPDNDTPPPWGWVHMCVRHDAAAQQQVLRFVETGCVVNFCGGACERPYCRA
ncbi:unnamed protein product [Pylaiella littoralis]